ncbi:proteinase inhibitor I78 [Streptomyces sp. AJS327]|uniref:proteinase inhibitor I78 n=1 Tax=Streptomyces sp. AJS327 TaxID=2545265 RepID=UPI0015DE1279|nr:proteinase inhibitor I78 [Streptomyces sp. AJS327]MBA0050566.1 proteinase inhibitor I78 [Streptomyces sp. AJS327]
MAPEPEAPDTAGDEPESYVGLSADAAERRAYEQGWSTVRRLAPDAIVTMEFLVGRLNLAVTDDTVVRCWKG